MIPFKTILAGALLLILTNSCKDAKPGTTLAITNISIIDAKVGQQDNMTIHLQGNKIIAVGKTREMTTPKGIQAIDGTDKYLLPGLWDAHVHLTYDQDISPAMFRLFLVNGVTSIRDTGGQLELVMPLKEAAEKAPTRTPRVMISGPLVDGLPRVYDGSSPGRPNLSVGAPTVEEVKAIVAKLDEAGVDLIKAYEMLEPEVFNALVKEATKRGLPVTGHVPLSMDVVSASNAGMRSIEHMRNLEMSCTADWEQLLESRRVKLRQGSQEAGGVLRSRLHQQYRYHAIENQDSATREQVLAILAKNNTWLVPTLTILTSRENRVYARPSWREQFKYLPDSAEGKWMLNAQRAADLSVDSSGVAFAQWGYDMVGRLPEAGVGMMAGTDTPIAFLTPGFSLHEELRLLVKSGLTPLQAIEAATLRPAEYFNLQNELGTIEEGKLADLLLLNANPLEDIRNTETIEAVIRDGHLYDRRALDIWLKELEEE